MPRPVAASRWVRWSSVRAAWGRCRLGLAQYLGGCQLGVSRAYIVLFPVAMEGMAVRDPCDFKGFHVPVEAHTTTPPQITDHT